MIQNQLYVADYAMSLVKIFDMDCNVIRTIQTKECPNPWDIAEGPDGVCIAALQMETSSATSTSNHPHYKPSTFEEYGLTVVVILQLMIMIIVCMYSNQV